MSPRILAIDPGEKRVGVAISDPTGVVATGLPTIKFTTVRELADQIADLCAKQGAEEVIVGYPLRLNGTEGPKAKESKELVLVLSEYLGIPVSLFDERLTTVQSHRILREGGMSGQKRRRLADQLSARILLQTYLETRRRR